MSDSVWLTSTAMNAPVRTAHGARITATWCRSTTISTASAFGVGPQRDQKDMCSRGLSDLHRLEPAFRLQRARLPRAVIVSGCSAPATPSRTPAGVQSLFRARAAGTGEIRVSGGDPNDLLDNRA
jgi:hypothetical protein